MSPRVKHILLIALSVGLPILAAVQDAFGGVQLGAWGSIGVIAAGLIAVLTNVTTLWKPTDAELAKSKKILAAVMTAASIVAPILTSVYTSLPPTTKGLAFIGIIAGLAASLKKILPPVVEAATSATPEPPKEN